MGWKRKSNKGGAVSDIFVPRKTALNWCARCPPKTNWFGRLVTERCSLTTSEVDQEHSLEKEFAALKERIFIKPFAEREETKSKTYEYERGGGSWVFSEETIPPRRLRCEADFYRLTFHTQPPCGFLWCCQFRISPFWKHLPKAVVLALVSPQSPGKRIQKSVELYGGRVETTQEIWRGFSPGLGSSEGQGQRKILWRWTSDRAHQGWTCREQGPPKKNQYASTKELPHPGGLCPEDSFGRTGSAFSVGAWQFHTAEEGAEVQAWQSGEQKMPEVSWGLWDHLTFHIKSGGGS